MNKYTQHFKDTLLSVVERNRGTMAKAPIWNIVAKEMAALFPKTKMTSESLRSLYRRLTDIRVHQVTKRRDDHRMGRVTLEQRVLPLVKQKRAISYLAETLNVPEGKILEALARLQANGYRALAIFKEDGVMYAHNRVRFNSTIPGVAGKLKGVDLTHLTEGDVVTFAVVSDTHFGSKFAAKRELGKFYDYVQSIGINKVLHVGDITDGYYTNRPTSVLEQDAVGFSEQYKQVIRQYPKREGVKTIFITGNHDYTHMRNGAANIGESIDDHEDRDDLEYIGHNFGRVWLHPKLDVSLIHPTDGSDRNLTTKIRQVIERNPERKSKIMLLGHYHKFSFIKDKGVFGYLVPSFQHKTSFMDDNNLSSEVAGLIFTIKLDRKGNIINISTEYVDYS